MVSSVYLARWLTLSSSEFHAFPLATVVIPEGGGTILYCEHTTFAVDWFKGETVISSSNQRVCDCTNVGATPGKYLTFTNFRSVNSAGQYGCWANRGIDFDECSFQVVALILKSTTHQLTTFANAWRLAYSPKGHGYPCTPGYNRNASVVQLDLVVESSSNTMGPEETCWTCHD